MKISGSQLYKKLDYKTLVEQLRLAFAGDDFHIPERQHLQLTEDNVGLIMPAWNDKYYGVKQIIACPGNPAKNLPTIQGKYDLYSVKNGRLLAEMDAAALTAIRTAASSVLASSFLVDRPKVHLIIGGGTIGQHLASAYQEFFDLERSFIWSRSDPDKPDLEKAFLEADIVSCATHAYEPVIFGSWINKPVHLDLVGSYKPNMREADDRVIEQCDIYIDDWPALGESGDLLIPLANKTISKSDIKATLFDLCKSGEKVSARRATLFKSVGHAIEDLAAAIYFYEAYF